MSKRNQIEQALLAMDGGRFQQLGDAYLSKLGYPGANPLGRALGSDKVAKGTPDTWIAQPDGKFIFAEYTTISRDKLAGKLHDDLNKCLDERRTGVPVSHIRRIFLVHTSVLSPADERTLLEKGEERGVIVTTIGLGPLTLDLYEKYPALALEYLGIEVDTGQILSQDDFISTYGMNELATPLDTAFTGRESDVADVLSMLESGNLVVVSGRAGVGKTRFVLECFRRFTEVHSGWTIRGILDRSRDLFNDLRAHLTPLGKYLVLVDDANRVSGFDYVLQILRDRRPDIELKVVATVRDYARDKVKQATLPYGGAREVELTPLAAHEISEILRTEYGILNSLFLDRIVAIAKGNPRLAMMAGRVATEENTLSSIDDVTSLYDRYFESVREELGGPFGDRTLLRVAGIISYLRVVDKCHSGQMDQIAHCFGITADAFWEAAQRLHEFELVDMYEDEVVKISDQVLATYLVHLATFVERGVLDPAILIREYFPAQRYRVMDAFYGVLDAFDAERIIGHLRPHVQRAVREAEAAGDESKLLHLVDAFWFAVPTDALVAIQQRLASMEPEPRPEPLNLDPRKVKGSI
ncbi:MAG TPA: ATP-binding protein, partial [Longimicrobium sp.]|nr:ATP-binding protein [Longimicrobium sp.]